MVGCVLLYKRAVNIHTDMAPSLTGIHIAMAPSLTA